MKNLWQMICVCVLSLVAISAQADAAAAEALVKFLAPYQQTSGDFKQVILDEKGSVLQTSQGSFALSRPVSGEAVGKFRWQTQKPSSQLLIADGKKIYFYDQSLQQVTVQKQQAAAMRNSPAMLLSGSLQEISQTYNVTQTQQGFVLQPKKESFFHTLTLRFTPDKNLDRMIVEDNLGQKTQIEFNHLKANVSPEAFRFSAPKGTDVINS